MAEIVFEDPGSGEVQSPIIAGITEALWRISNALNLTVGTLKDEPMSAVYVDNQKENKNRIYTTGFQKKLWLKSPTPIIKKNGVEIQNTVVPFSIDYIGGSVTFSANLKDEDKITVSCQYISGRSTTIETLSNSLQTLNQKAGKYKGYFDSLNSLESAYSSAESGDFAVVEKPDLAVYAWNETLKKWDNSQSIENLDNYYTKEQAKQEFAGKDTVITGNGNAKAYLGGDKLWREIDPVIRAATLVGLDVLAKGDVQESDSILSAIGKLQNQSKTSKESVFISGTGEPSVNTVGKVGQRYVNTSNGDVYKCISASGNSYKWEKYGDMLKSVYDTDGDGVIDNAFALGGHNSDYFSTKEETIVCSAMFSSSNWSGGGPYTQTVSCPGMMPEPARYSAPWFNKTGIRETDSQLSDSFLAISDGYLENLEGQMKATVYEKPSKDIQIYVRRAGM